MQKTLCNGGLHDEYFEKKKHIIKIFKIRIMDWRDASSLMYEILEILARC